MHVFLYMIDSTIYLIDSIIVSFIKKDLYTTVATKLSKKVDTKKKFNLKELFIQLKMY